MGGPGSGGYKNTPGDTETHAAWAVIPQEPGSVQKLPQVQCKYCAREMAQHTSRQRAHLLSCNFYLDAMKEQGIETSITRQAADPAGFFNKPRPSSTAGGAGAGGILGESAESKPPKPGKVQEHSAAVRIQALALAEATISAERIQEITGVDPKTLAWLRKLARERGYDPNISMQLKEEYIVDPPSLSRPKGRPKKRKPEDMIDPALPQSTTTLVATDTASPASSRAPPGYVQAESLPPGNWDFTVPPTGQVF